MDWFKTYLHMKTAANNYPRSRVFAADYMRLMRELNAGNRNLHLLNKMIADVEDAVKFVYWNTVAWGHTSNEMSYPCPKCNPGMDLNDETVESLMTFINPDDPPEEYVDEPDDSPEQLAQNKGYLDSIRGIDPDGVFHCNECGMDLPMSKLDEMIKDPEGGGRGVMISDHADHIIAAWEEANSRDTFERKFPYFEKLIEYWHGSGDLAHWFIEGGRATIDKYRPSRLPERNWNEIPDYGW